MGVAWSGSDDTYRAFIDQYGLSFPQIDDTSAEVFGRFGVPGQPAIAVIRPDGRVETLFGAADDAVLDAILGDAVAA